MQADYLVERQDISRVTYRGHTNNWPEAAGADKPGPLDWIREQGDLPTLQFAAPLQPPRYASRGQ
jgi:hypothetical protein